MEPLKEFNQELNIIQKQRIKLQKHAQSIIQKLREKYPTKNPEVEHLLDIAERAAENELNFFDLENYYKKGYHEVEIGASYREILKKYGGCDEKIVIDPRDYFDLVFADHQLDIGPFLLDIELDENEDIIEYVDYYHYEE